MDGANSIIACIMFGDWLPNMKEPAALADESLHIADAAGNAVVAAALPAASES